jgi:hypothetical protein
MFSLLSDNARVLFLSTVLSDENLGTHNQYDQNDLPAGLRIPPTPLPPGSPIPNRVRAFAQLLPVSIPDIVRDVAGNNPQHNNVLQTLTVITCQTVFQRLNHLCKEILINIERI